MKKVLIISGTEWNSTIQRHHVIARWFAQKGMNVDFLEGIVSSTFSLKKLIARLKATSHTKIVNPCEFPINLFRINLINPNNGLFKIYNKATIKNYYKYKDEYYDIVICYVPVNTTLMILNELEYDCLIYDCVRAFENWGGYPKDILVNEDVLINKANFIFVDSFYLKNKMLSNYKNKNKVFQFLPHLGKEEYQVYSKNNPKKFIKTILYFGRVYTHLDLKLLKKLNNKGYVINLIGSIDCVLDFDYNDLGYYSDKKELAKAIIENADAIIIPYKGNMDGVVPAKLMQAMATQLPVYINMFYDSNYLKEYLYVYENENHLIDMLENYNYNDHIIKLKNVNTFIQNNLEIIQGERLEAILDSIERGVE